MASSELTTNINLIAGEDLRNGVYSLLTLENDGGLSKVIKATAPTQFVVGVLAEDPNPDISTDGINVPVTLLSGRIPMIAAGSITAGQLVVASTTAGKVEGVADIAALTADNMAIGVALESAVAGDYFDVLCQPIAG